MNKTIGNFKKRNRKYEKYKVERIIMKNIIFEIKY